MVSASGSETSACSSTPTSAIIYDAYTFIIKKYLYNKKKKNLHFTDLIQCLSKCFSVLYSCAVSIFKLFKISFR